METEKSLLCALRQAPKTCSYMLPGCSLWKFQNYSSKTVTGRGASVSFQRANTGRFTDQQKFKALSFRGFYFTQETRDSCLVTSWETGRRMEKWKWYLSRKGPSGQRKQDCIHKHHCEHTWTPSVMQNSYFLQDDGQCQRSLSWVSLLHSCSAQLKIIQKILVQIMPPIVLLTKTRKSKALYPNTCQVKPQF